MVSEFSVGETSVGQGSIVLFSHVEEQGPMWTGVGPREVVRVVVFDAPFLSAPAVHVGLGMWDIDCGTNNRADLSVLDVTAEGFAVRFRTWGDTRIARLRVDWLAIGCRSYADDFILSD